MVANKNLFEFISYFWCSLTKIYYEYQYQNFFILWSIRQKFEAFQLANSLKTFQVWCYFMPSVWHICYPATPNIYLIPSFRKVCIFYILIPGNYFDYQNSAIFCLFLSLRMNHSFLSNFGILNPSITAGNVRFESLSPADSISRNLPITTPQFLEAFSVQVSFANSPSFVLLIQAYLYDQCLPGLSNNLVLCYTMFLNRNEVQFWDLN